jgi:subtilisin family serine protease
MNSRTHFPVGTWLLLMVVAMCLAAPMKVFAQPETAAGRQLVRDEVIVQFHPGAVDSDKASVRALVAGTARESLSTRVMEETGTGDLELVGLPAGTSVGDAIARLRSHTWVRFAEPNWIYTHHELVANDPSYQVGLLWGMTGVASRFAKYGANAAGAWAAGHVGSSTVHVAVIDEGVMRTHRDLAQNMWTNAHDPIDGLDNDGNGYVDDRYGWDFAGGNNGVYDGASDDHGTHVAGTIGAVGGNGIGVVGVNWNVTIIPVKFLGRQGGTTANAIRALDYVTDLKRRHGIDVVATNNSWGGGGFSQALLDAINRAGDAGILFVAAAGNGGSDLVGDSNDISADYPSAYECTLNRAFDCVIAVTALSPTGRLASFANHGASSVDIAAPGVGILSTVPGRHGRESGYGIY